jgi:hypothetical protein
MSQNVRLPDAMLVLLAWTQAQICIGSQVVTEDWSVQVATAVRMPWFLRVNQQIIIRPCNIKIRQLPSVVVQPVILVQRVKEAANLLNSMAVQIRSKLQPVMSAIRLSPVIQVTGPMPINGKTDSICMLALVISPVAFIKKINQSWVALKLQIAEAKTDVVP